ncbi:MAG TPA: F0F1 ATP synthase subunit delta [Candidatus Coprenecus stercoravium]|uniref:ATP synthase subunit delta n=1 Tax=Candidatus Coprenecus stercoravium TaxID=2840735 RepID=A0A9D2GRN1_9BACT|nr:F0F1 ATP synthase subunit delta [Candidatus Coprenecus stercoravium]
MDIGLISRRYATALAEYSAEAGEEAEVYRQLLPLTQHYDYVPAVRETLLSPMVSQEDKAKVIFALLGDSPCRSLRDFVYMVLRHRRESCLYFILHSFVDIYRERHRIKEAELITAAALGDGVGEAVRRMMEDRCGCTVNISSKVDPSIIGGFVFRMEDTLIDASVASQLRLLRRRLGSNPAKKI